MAVIIGAMIVLSVGNYGLLKLIALQMEESKLEVEIQQVKDAQKSLDSLIKKLETDSLYIERQAREQLQMQKPKEKVYKIVP